MAEAGKAYITISISPGSAAKVKSEASAIGKSIGETVAEISIKLDKASVAETKLEAAALGRSIQDSLNVDTSSLSNHLAGLGRDFSGVRKEVDHLAGSFGQVSTSSRVAFGKASSDWARAAHDINNGLEDVTKGTDDLAKSSERAVRGFVDLGKAGDKIANSLNRGIGVRIGGVQVGIGGIVGELLSFPLRVGGAIQKGLSAAGDAVAQFGMDASQAATEGEQVTGMFAQFGAVLGELSPVIGLVAGGLAALGAALLVLPTLVGAVTVVLVALLDVVTTLVSIFAAFVAPLTLVAGLLGGLGAAFAYVAQQSLKNKTSLQDQHDALLALHVAQQTYNQDVQKYTKNSTQAESALLSLHKAQDTFAQAQIGASLNAAHLDDKLHQLGLTLTRDFAPYIIQGAKAAGILLSYLDKVAKLPLDKAFRSLATTGVEMINDFVYALAHVVAKPIRLAIKLAFGTGPAGSDAQKALNDWWTSLQRYFFGYTRDHPLVTSANVRTASARGGRRYATGQVPGALGPIQDFFNRQDFTKAGQEMTGDIVDAVVHGPSGKRLRQYFTSVGSDAGSAAASAFQQVFIAELQGLPGLFGKILHGLGNVLNQFTSWLNKELGQAFFFGSAWVHAFDWLKRQIEGLFSSIGGLGSGIYKAITGAVGAAVSWVRRQISGILSSHGAGLGLLGALNLGGLGASLLEKVKSILRAVIGTAWGLISRAVDPFLQDTLAKIRLGFSLLGAFIDKIGHTVFGRFWQSFQTLALRAFNAATGAIRGFFSLLGSGWDWVKKKAGSAFTAIENAVGGVIDNIRAYIELKVGGAWDWVKSKVSGLWGTIKSIIEAPLNITINWPPVPDPFKSILGGAKSLGQTFYHAATGHHTGGLIPRYADGGIATGGIRGYDNVPALLTPGEIVMNDAMQRNLLSMLYHPRWNAGAGSGGDTNVEVYLGNDQIEPYMVRVVREENRRTARRVQAGRMW
jgi:phage-related protein